MKNKKIIFESLILLAVFFLSYNFSLAAGCCVKDINANSASNCIKNVANAAACSGAFMNYDPNCEYATSYCSNSPESESTFPVSESTSPGNSNNNPSAAAPLTDTGSVAAGGGVVLPTNTGLSSKTIAEILTKLLNWLLQIVGIIAIIGFVISGIMYLVSAGNEEMVTKAKKYMLYCLIGVVVVLASFVVIKTIDSILNANLSSM